MVDMRDEALNRFLQRMTAQEEEIHIIIPAGTMQAQIQFDDHTTGEFTQMYLLSRAVAEIFLRFGKRHGKKSMEAFFQSYCAITRKFIEDVFDRRERDDGSGR